MSRPSQKTMYRRMMAPHARLAVDVFAALTWSERVVLIGGSVVCIVAARTTAAAIGLPMEPGFGGSLLTGPGGVGRLLAGVGIAVLGLAIGAVVARRMGLEGAVFCAALGLAGVASRCGPIRPVLMYQGTGALGLMAVELVVLTAAVLGGWMALNRLTGGRSAVGATMVPNEIVAPTVRERVEATLFTAAIVAGLELIFIQTDGSKQCLGGVAVASLLGTIGGYMIRPIGEGVWFWAAPAVVGVVGYVVALATGDGRGTGELTGYLAAWGRPTPLHYASLGIAGAAIAHWSARRWALAESAELPGEAASP